MFFFSTVVTTGYSTFFTVFPACRVLKCAIIEKNRAEYPYSAPSHGSIMDRNNLVELR